MVDDPRSGFINRDQLLGEAAMDRAMQVARKIAAPAAIHDIASFVPSKLRPIDPAGDILDALIVVLRDFEAGLDDEHEVGAYVAGSHSPVHVRGLRKMTQHMLIFEGVDGAGNQTLAVQHVSQLNLQLVALPKLSASAYRIGFILPQE